MKIDKDFIKIIKEIKYITWHNSIKEYNKFYKKNVEYFYNVPIDIYTLIKTTIANDYWFSKLDEKLLFYKGWL